MVRLKMEKAKKILGMHAKNWPYRDIGLSVGCGKTAVGQVIAKAKSAGVMAKLEDGGMVWERLSEGELEARLYPDAAGGRGAKGGGLEMAKVLTEISRKNMTRFQAWVEYNTDNPDGLQYSQFCKRVRDARKSNEMDYHKAHRAGEECEVDWAGSTVPYFDMEEGKWKEACLFVGVLPASCYPFVRAYADMKMPSWLDAHVRMFEFFGGAPRVLVPDCAKTAVAKADIFDPVPTRAYNELAAHYGAVVVPARPRKPKDKNYVENTVQNVSRRILAPLRDERFTGIAGINEAIRPLLQALIDRPFQKMAGSRGSAFALVDKPALSPLPPAPYEFAEHAEQRIGVNYHAQFDGFFYSVPYEHRGKECVVRATARAVEVYVGGVQVCAHARNYNTRDRYATLPEHLPEAHRAVSDWNDGRFISWAGKFGPRTVEYVKGLLASTRHSVQAYRACMGVMRQAGGKPAGLVEAASEAAARDGHFSSRYFGAALRAAGLAAGGQAAGPVAEHGNIRGKGAFARGGADA